MNLPARGWQYEIAMRLVGDHAAFLVVRSGDLAVFRAPCPIAPNPEFSVFSFESVASPEQKDGSDCECIVEAGGALRITKNAETRDL